MVDMLGDSDTTMGDHRARAAGVMSQGYGVVDQCVHRCGGWMQPLVDMWGLGEAWSHGCAWHR
jgi:hypothetical protein